jgi:pentapeptide repeat protein
MNYTEFKRALRAFVDEDSDFDDGQGQIVAKIRDEDISISVTTEKGDLFVEEAGTKHRAHVWLLNRVAKLDQLATRILDRVSKEPAFVTPTGELLDFLENNPSGNSSSSVNSLHTASEILGKRPAGISTVLYLTADAGEGKTTVINQLALDQADRFLKRECDWLLVPISLSGRSFLTFDDIVVADLVNKYRFQFLYYGAFLELVKLGVIVPAFDGFEEMFVEGRAEEAVSALGNLMSDLESKGTVLIAARTAYFEYRSFATQAKLFDGFRDESVSFAKLELNKWNKKEFLEYCTARDVPKGDDLYGKVCVRLRSPLHPLLTRAVLVKRLIDVAEEDGLDALLTRIGTNPEDYFFHFVNTIIEREATEKWIDRSGQPHKPLLSVEEHHHLLGMIAKEMWLSSSEALRGDYLELIADLLAQEHGKSAEMSRQIVSRIRHHSLLGSTDARNDNFSFDHEDFRRFYLGETLGETLTKGDPSDTRLFLEKSLLQSETLASAIAYLARHKGDTSQTIRLLQSLPTGRATGSFLSDNVGGLLIRLLDTMGASPCKVTSIFFPPDAFRGLSLENVEFEGCSFQESSLEGTRLINCNFVRCEFHRLDFFESTQIGKTKLLECTVSSLQLSKGDHSVFDPAQVVKTLVKKGFNVESEVNHSDDGKSSIEPSEEAVLAESALRIFMRSTITTGEIFGNRFGRRSAKFKSDVLPLLLEADVILELPPKGGGKSPRYRLNIPMRHIDQAIPLSVETIEEFIEIIRLGKN